MPIYESDLKRLQELRERAKGQERKEIQEKIDYLFLYNPKRTKRKRKKKIKIQNPDDMWW